MENKNILSRLRFVTTPTGDLYIVIPSDLKVLPAETKVKLPEADNTGRTGLDETQIIVKYE